MELIRSSCRRTARTTRGSPGHATRGQYYESEQGYVNLQTLRNETADSWNERTSWLRYENGAGMLQSGFSVWGKAYYGQIDRNTTNTLTTLGTTFTFDASYRQTYGGIQIGADYMFRGPNGGAWVVGALGGFNKSDINFDANTDAADIAVYNLGLYASFMRGPLFPDLLVKADITRIDLNLPSISS